MADYGTFKWGQSSFPLTSSLTNSLLKDADPVVYNMLLYFTSVLNTHLGTRFAAQATAAGKTMSLIASSVPFDPMPYLLQDQLKFPLLAVYRASDDFEHVTVTWDELTSEIDVVYALPPLTAGQAEQLLPMLTAIGRVIRNRTEMKKDPAYNSGELWFQTAGITKLLVKSATYGDWLTREGEKTEYFPCVSITLEATERVMPETDFLTYSGADVNIADGLVSIKC